MKIFTRTSFYTVLFLLFSFSVSSQTTWEKLFSRKNTDAFRTVIEVPAGGYMIVGYTSDSTLNDTDGYVVRMTNAGDTLWTRRINGTNSGKDLYYKVINTSDGGFAICGYSTNNGVGNDDAHWLKLDANGAIQWSKYWGGSGKDRAQDIIQTTDGGYAIIGYTTTPPSSYYDAFLIRTNGSGDTLWTRLYGSGGFDDANSIVELPDSGFVLGGQSTNGANGLDMYFFRINQSGDTLWTRKFGTTATDNIEKVIRQSDGTFMLAGGSDGPGFGGNDGVLVKADSGGSVLWTKNYGGNSQDDFHQVYKTTDGGFILSGTSRSSGPVDPNLWMVKTNSSGDSLWTRTYGGDNNDHGYSAIQTSDGGYIFVGYTSSFGFNAEEAYVVKTNNAGDVGDLLTYVTVSALTRPINGTCTANNFQVRVIVRNYGLDTVPNVPVTIQITGPISQTINATYAGAIFPGDLDTLAFSTLIDLSTPGQYTFSCTSSNVNDVFPQNNNLLTTVTINSTPAAPTVTPAQNCGPGLLTLNAASSFPMIWYNAQTGGSIIASGSSYQTTFNTTTTLYVAANDGACSSSRTPVTARIFTLPSVSLGPDTLEISFGQTVTLDAGSGFTSYNWSTGATTQTVEISTTTLVIVTVTDTNNCQNTDTIFVNQVVGIEDLLSQARVRVFPNPTSGMFEVSVDRFNEDVEMRIFNILGDEILNDTFTEKGYYANRLTTSARSLIGSVG